MLFPCVSDTLVSYSTHFRISVFSMTVTHLLNNQNLYCEDMSVKYLLFFMLPTTFRLTFNFLAISKTPM